MGKRSFPKGFLWGASTAAHQVEGGTHNQWSVWEQANADRLAATFTKRLSWLPRFKDVEKAGADPANYISGNGVEHYARYKEDFTLLKQLNMNAYRFSIEWSRIEPQEGSWDEGEVEHYRQYIAELNRLGIEPILTLWHWTMPVWFTDKGGFSKRRNVRYFERFAAYVAKQFCNDVRYVLTLNEPNVYAALSYIMPDPVSKVSWPPERRNPILGWWVLHNLVDAHRRAYRTLKRTHPHLCVGIAMQLGEFRPLRPANPINRFVAHTVAYVSNWWFLDRIHSRLDILGFNYYFTTYITWTGGQHNPQKPISDLSWYMEPAGIGRLLQTVWKRYHKPLLIVENGLADARDAQRQWWITETLTALHTALQAGVDLRGYLHWSLLDNFEWSFGWWPKFGLVAVDRKTMKRTIRPSAKWFAEQFKHLQ